MLILSACSVDSRRVVLYGDSPDYINASFVDVSVLSVMKHTCIIDIPRVFLSCAHAGLSAKESFHNCSEPITTYGYRFLEDDYTAKVFSHSHAM